MKDFLNSYDTVIFDMDGVITSEEIYWDVAALTVDEFLKSSNYFGRCQYDAKSAESEVKEIRSRVFADDALISVIKNKGVNSNWDLAYITLLMCVAEKTDNGAELLSLANSLGDDTFKIYSDLEKMSGISTSGLWDRVHNCFQEWILGDDGYIRVYGRQPVECGKTGLLYNEEPLLPLKEITELLARLSETKRLCIGTGRPESEIIPQLKRWDILKFFDSCGIITYNDVLSAEDKFSQKLRKPHPYVFIKAMSGSVFSDDEIIRGQYDKTAISRTLVVGDAGADLFAARAMGADFCAVLTGVMKDSARGFFEKNNVEYILDSVCDML